MKIKSILLLLLLCKISFAQIHPLPLTQVSVNDPFWSPKLATWSHKTVYDVLNKLEGKYEPDRQDLVDEKQKLGHTRNAFHNFDLVAQGKKDIGTHDGPPWYDGLVYESIRGAADLLVQYPDPTLEQQLDGYITRIAAAQAADPDAYLNTYTTLVNSNKRWQNERWQHDLYNAGMLVEAGVHYYKATGKTTLLTVAVKMANYIYTQMGPAPKANIIPGHGGPEEAFLKLYQLFKDHPALKLAVPVTPDHYLSTALFWITDRGHYNNPDGSTRESYGAYNQDQSSVFEQQTIEGHAVRATLLATGITTAALLNHDPAYITTADNYWNNMAGKRTFITGGQGAIPEDEKFGPDYYLPESAYLETCAAVGAAFFSEKMNELKEDGKYMDEFERVIYNNLLAGVSQDGTHYFYENPLTATHRSRWVWHDCPCCPPMFLKMIGALP
ncbi:glycoside hydrolase family 127 protein, partial [Chitinophaga sancti]|uniref:glycoside hydrolase family 127 protein n=1 Tax=Chitinophaga sancti TaxID=1004 RepID=UPI003F7A4F3F